MKPTIAIDMDEVLFPLSAELVRRHNLQFATGYTSSDFVTYVLGDVWGTTYTESVAKVHALLSEDLSEVRPVVGAVDAVRSLLRDYALVVVTSRDRLLQTPTVRWLERHFEGLFVDVVFAGNPHTGRGFRAKQDVCQHLDAVCLIDDSVDHACDCASSGLPVILFGDYPWNQTTSLPAGVTRAQTWPQARELVQPIFRL